MTEKFKWLSVKLEGELLEKFENIFQKSGFASRTEFVRSLIKKEADRLSK